MKPFANSNSILNNTTLLRQRLGRDGYLFFSNILPPTLLEPVRSDIINKLTEFGWIIDGAVNLNKFCVEPQPDYLRVYSQVYKFESFHAVPHYHNIKHLMYRLLGSPVFSHPRVFGRFIFPDRPCYTTPSHQDYIGIQGAADTYTLFVPLSDIPSGQGGVAVVPGSHREGLFDFEPELGAGGISIVKSFGDRWESGTLNRGDMLLFHSYTVHKGVPNRTDKLRISIDFRYQRISEPVMNWNLDPHPETMGWDDVYKRWRHNDFRYYWKDFNLNVVDFDRRFWDKRDQMAFDLAEQGNPKAAAVLERIVMRDPDRRKRERATHLLAKLNV